MCSFLYDGKCMWMVDYLENRNICLNLGRFDVEEVSWMVKKNLTLFMFFSSIRHFITFAIRQNFFMYQKLTTAN